MRNQRILVLSVLLVAAATPAVVSAEGLEFALRAGVAYSDNVLRSSVAPEGASAAVVGAQLATDKSTGRWRYSLTGDGAWNEYLGSDVEGQFLGSFSGESSYEFVPDVFSWNLSGNFDQLRRDIASPLVSGNIEDSLSLATGPTLELQLPGGFSAGIEGRFATIDYSDRDFDNETVGVRAVLVRAFSERSAFGIGASWDDVSYRSGAAATGIDYDRREYFARMRFQGARTSLEADAGFATVRGDGLDEDGPMFRVGATRRVTPSITAFARLQQEFPTSEPSTFAGNGAVLTAESRETRSVEFGFEYQRPRTDAQVAVGTQRERSLVSLASQRDVDTVSLSLRRALTPRSSVRVFCSLANEEVPSLGLDDEELSGGAEFSIGFGRKLGLDLRVEYRDRASPLLTNDYQEFSAGLYIRYGSVSQRSAIRGLGAD